MSQPPREGPWLGQVQTPPPEPRRRIPVVALAVAALLVVAVAIGALLMNNPGPPPSPAPTAIAGSPPAATATPALATPRATPARPTPSAGPTASPATPDPGQSPTIGRRPPPEIASQIDEVVEQVPLIRDLQPLRDVPYVLLSREEFQSELEAMLEDEVDLSELDIEGRLLQRLGMLPDDTDLYELMLQLYGSQVAAYYRPDTGTFYIIERDEPFAAVDRMIVAHEYTHALQDQHFDLEGSRISDPSEGDAALAQLAAIEGDATLLMFQWALEALTMREQLELFAGLVPSPTDQEILENMPPVLRRQLEFPYNDGFIFSTEVQRRGGWSAIDDTLAEPPASTEQILHPEKYFAGEQPVMVFVPDPLPALGDEWQDIYQQTMGELNLQIWLADGESPPMVIPGIEIEPVPWQAAAAGWGGDRLHMYENEDGGWAIVWLTAWDSVADAEEFEAAAQPLLAGLDGPADLSEGPEGELYRLLLVASDEDTLRALRSGLR
ncbi:MAG TPA: hypothetical protein VM305_01015 [Candidatus Limnocylindrales bacterium]|nr:hypothetical protein [Candidatus Limnocylindrales bacterium]